MATTEGRTFTRDFSIETKQHDFLNIDLGEGLPRRQLGLGIVLTLAWCALLWPLIGFPDPNQASLYVFPPVLFAYYGYAHSKDQPRRRAYVQWAVRVRYMTTGCRPIINLGGRKAHRNERVPFPVRFAWPGSILKKFFPAWFKDEEEMRERFDEEIVAGAPIRMVKSARIVGFDHMEKVRQGRAA